MQAVGANQMKYLKNLVGGRDLFDRRPSQHLVINQGQKYEYIPALVLHHKIWAYTYTGREIILRFEKYAGKK